MLQFAYYVLLEATAGWITLLFELICAVTLLSLKIYYEQIAELNEKQTLPTHNPSSIQNASAFSASDESTPFPPPLPTAQKGKSGSRWHTQTSDSAYMSTVHSLSSFISYHSPTAKGGYRILITPSSQEEHPKSNKGDIRLPLTAEELSRQLVPFVTGILQSRSPFSHLNPAATDELQLASSESPPRFSSLSLDRKMNRTTKARSLSSVALKHDEAHVSTWLKTDAGVYEVEVFAVGSGNVSHV
jgi:hypothetical protein